MDLLFAEGDVDFSQLDPQELRKHAVQPKVIFDAYAYGEVFHQHEHQQAIMQRLRTFDHGIWLVLVRYVMVTSIYAIRLRHALDQGGFLRPNADSQSAP